MKKVEDVILTNKVIIPEGWVIMNFKEICKKFIHGGTPSTQKKHYWSGSIPWITGADINNQQIKIVRRFIDDCAVKESSTNIVPFGNLIIVTRTGVGKIAVSNYDVAISQDLTGVILNENFAFIKFIFYAFIANNSKLKELNQGTSINGITRKVLEKFKVLLPQLSEQKAIANVLGLMDSAINMNNELIKQKESQKIWLMHNLLSGKKRLMGFKKKWDYVSLGVPFKRVTRKNLEKNLNVVTISAQKGFVKQSEYFKKNIASEITDNYFLVHKGEFCYNKSYSNGYPWGATKRLNDYEKAVVTTLYICFELRDSQLYSGDFFEQYFERNFLNRGLTEIAHEGGRAHGLLNVTTDDFFSIKICFPSFEEQIAIAQILQTADKEIQILKSKSDKLKEQKKGMMQVLLTGKKRLKHQ